MLEREMKNTLQHYHGLIPKGVKPLNADQFNKNSKTQGKTRLGHQGDMYSRLRNVTTKRKEPHACTIDRNIDSH